METFDLEPGDETDAKSEPPSSAGRLLLYAVAAGGLIGIGSLVIGHSTADPEVTPAPSPTRQISPLPFEPQPLLVGDACAVHTDHRNVLSMSFSLQNVSSAEAAVTEVKSIRSPGGLRQVGVTVSGGSCRRPGRQPVRSPIEAGQARFFTVRWELPDTCPEPYPLQVRVTYFVPHKVMERTDDLTVRVDLGDIGFLQCPKVVTALPTPVGGG